jgi:hypothetical protein
MQPVEQINRVWANCPNPLTQLLTDNGCYNTKDLFPPINGSCSGLPSVVSTVTGSEVKKCIKSSAGSPINPTCPTGTTLSKIGNNNYTINACYTIPICKSGIYMDNTGTCDILSKPPIPAICEKGELIELNNSYGCF